METNINANPFEAGSDELERYAMEECVKRQRLEHRVSVLILPAGRCEMAIKFARLGATVTVADDAERQQDVQGRILASGLGEQIRFQAATLGKLPDELAGQPFDIIIVRRGLCGLPYDIACQVTRQLLLRLRIGGKLYLSILGLHSELGQGYAGAETPIDQRFAPLSAALVKKYGIQGEVCLYTERNLFMLLLEAGASVLRTLTTTYGNVKGIAVRV